MKMKLTTVLLLSGLSSSLLQAAPFDGSAPMLCSVSQVNECVADFGCDKVSRELSEFPDFLRINLGDKLITGLSGGETTGTTMIERSENIDGKLMMGGAEDGKVDQRDGVSWSIAIEENSGAMTATAATDGLAYAVFGACTPLP